MTSEPFSLSPQTSRERHLQSKVEGLYNTHIKRLAGLTLAIPLLLALSPALLVIAVAIIVDSGWSVLYRGERSGLGGKPFRIFKFRTMVVDAERIGGGTTALSDPRVTRVGAFLRRTKLDEFPQLLNIIRGEMCFVGPRPELLRYTSAYHGLERYILQVRPGITDFSSIEFISLDELVGSSDADSVYEQQVLGRKNQLRIEYVAQMSPWTDLRLFTTTVGLAFGRLLRPVGRGRRHRGTH